MEDGLVHVKNEPEKLKDAGLNPCCDGRWSRTYVNPNKEDNCEGLNPCCDGRWSRTVMPLSYRLINKCLNPCCDGRWSRTMSQITVGRDGDMS